MMAATLQACRVVTTLHTTPCHPTHRARTRVTIGYVNEDKDGNHPLDNWVRHVFYVQRTRWSQERTRSSSWRGSLIKRFPRAACSLRTSGPWAAMGLARGWRHRLPRLPRPAHAQPPSRLELVHFKIKTVVAPRGLTSSRSEAAAALRTACQTALA